MYVMRVEITYPDDRKKIYKVGAAFELEVDDEVKTYLAMRRLEDGEFGFIPRNIIKSWKVLD